VSRYATALFALVLVFALGLVAAGCGGDDDDGTTSAITTDTTTGATTDEEETTTDEDEGETTTDEDEGMTTDGGEGADGAAVFAQAACGSCHVFSAAGSSGTVGPSLDASTKSESEIEEQVRQGSGAMPAFEGQLSDDEIEAVAAYVVENRTG
jgi:cytochrome c553